MNVSPSPASLSAAVPEMVRRLMAVLAPLAGLVAAAFVHRPGLAALGQPLWLRLMHIGRRIAAVRVGFVPGRSRAGEVRGERKTPRLAFPGRRGWLVKELGYQGAAYASQLALVLDDPEMRAVIDASPGFGRVLRPICWMLGISRERATSAAELVAVKPGPVGGVVARGVARAGRRRAPVPVVVVRPPVEVVPRVSPEIAWNFAKYR